jgi:hypothetical protein
MSSGRSFAQVKSKNFLGTSYAPCFTKATLDEWFGNAATVLPDYYQFATDALLQTALDNTVDNQDADIGPGAVLRDMGKECRVGAVGNEPRLTFRLVQFVTLGPNDTLYSVSDTTPLYVLTEVRSQTLTNSRVNTPTAVGYYGGTPFNTNFYNVGVARV